MLLRVGPAGIEITAGGAQAVTVGRDEPGEVDQCAHAAASEWCGERDHGAEAIVPGGAVSGDREGCTV